MVTQEYVARRKVMGQTATLDFKACLTDETDRKCGDRVKGMIGIKGPHQKSKPQFCNYKVCASK